MRNEIEKLSKFLVDWRANHKAPTPLPQEVWTKAVEIAGRHGASATAKALKLDYSALKRRMARATVPAVPDFVEFIPNLPMQTAVLDCILEVQSSTGSRLRVEVRALPVVDLAAMIQDFQG